VSISNGIKVLQGVCSELALVRAIDSIFENSVYVFSAPEDNTCFAVPFSHWFSAFDVDEVPLILSIQRFLTL